MKSSRKRNVARKPKSNRVHTGNISTPLPKGSPHEQASVQAPSRFVSQNRINAQHSTGPRTPEGKAISSQNALKHGLSIQRHAVLRGKDPALYAQLLAAVLGLPSVAFDIPISRPTFPAVRTAPSSSPPGVPAPH